MRLTALALLGLVAPLALAQEADPPDPLAPPPPSEQALRRETGRLLVRLAQRRTAPLEEDVLLALTVATDGRPFEQERVVEVAVRRRERGCDVRVRFREPAALRDQAHLHLADGRAWSHDPARRRADRAGPLEPSWRVGGGGLLLADLRPEDLEAHDYSHERDDVIALEGPQADRAEARVHVVRAVARQGGATRLLWIDRERHVTLRITHIDADGRVERDVRALGWRWVQGLLRPSAFVITEPALGRSTRVTVRGRRSPAPEARFDPARFFE